MTRGRAAPRKSGEALAADDALTAEVLERCHDALTAMTRLGYYVSPDVTETMMRIPETREQVLERLRNNGRYRP